MTTARTAVRPILLAGIVASVTSTLVQVLLWVVFTDAFPAILWRDTRLAAAILLGDAVLAPASAPPGLWVTLVAAAVHLVLSVAFAAALWNFVRRSSLRHALLVGAGFGVGLYVLAMHVMTGVYPWFAVARGPITLAAHVAFGMSAAAVMRPRPRFP